MIAQTLPKSINPTFTYSAFDENDGQWLCIDGQLGDFRILVIISSFSWIQPHIKYIVNISKSHNLATGKTFADTFRVEESWASLTVRILRYEIEKELEAIGWKREFLLLHNLRGLCLYLNFILFSDYWSEKLEAIGWKRDKNPSISTNLVWGLPLFGQVKYVSRHQTKEAQRKY